MRETASRTTRRTSPEGLRLGERLRQLRVAAGLTQSELAGDRFSKEYVSQIERGKTRPTEGTIEWLADRLGVDAGFLASGVATDERARLEGALSRAEALYEAQQDTEAVEAFEPLVAAARATGMPELQVRALAGSGLAKMRTGEHRAAVELLNEARSITEAESFSDVERADVLFWLGCCRYQLTSSQTALALFNEALGLAERSGLPCDALKANILSWRSRCWQRQRDFEAARDDVERALELSQGVEDLRTIGAAYFQASLIADREGHWVLARNYAERAREAYGQLADRVHVSQLTNNLGGLNFLLGNTDQAVKLLKESFAIALDLGRDADAGRAVSSLAQVHLRTGRRRAGRGPGAPGARSPRRTRRLRRRDRERPARARASLLEQDGSTRRRRHSSPPRRASATSDQVAIARPCGSLAATWRSTGGPRTGGRAVPDGRRGSTGRPLLGNGRR